MFNAVNGSGSRGTKWIRRGTEGRVEQERADTGGGGGLVRYAKGLSGEDKDTIFRGWGGGATDHVGTSNMADYRRVYRRTVTLGTDHNNILSHAT